MGMFKFGHLPDKCRDRQARMEGGPAAQIRVLTKRTGQMTRAEEEKTIMKPVIGLVPLVDTQRDSYWMLPGYMKGIQTAGGLPVMLPLEAAPEDLSDLSRHLDGFLFTGGQDVSPDMYHEEMQPFCGETCPERDRLERLLFAQALKEHKPVLGICRGIQLINVLMGGTLYQDLPRQHPSCIEHHGQPPYDRPVHSIHIEKGTPLYRLCGDEMRVNSYHHQAIRTLAPGLRKMAEAEDGIIEAVYCPDAAFLWGVQFHPEFSWQTDNQCQLIFDEFVRNCRSR